MKKTKEMTVAKAAGKTTMASNADKSTIKGERFLTVSIYPEAKSNVPWIRLRGLWLLQAGFTPQTRIRVRVMSGCLVITKD